MRGKAFSKENLSVSGIQYYPSTNITVCVFISSLLVHLFQSFFFTHSSVWTDCLCSLHMETLWSLHLIQKKCCMIGNHAFVLYIPLKGVFLCMFFFSSLYMPKSERKEQQLVLILTSCVHESWFAFRFVHFPKGCSKPCIHSCGRLHSVSSLWHVSGDRWGGFIFTENTVGQEMKCGNPGMSILNNSSWLKLKSIQHPHLNTKRWQ